MGLFKKKAELPLIPVEVRKRAHAPHCDQRVLHAPGQCVHCDEYSDWQALRELWGINFTGQTVVGRTMCPSEYWRPLDQIERWPGNQPSPWQYDPVKVWPPHRPQVVWTGPYSSSTADGSPS